MLRVQHAQLPQNLRSILGFRISKRLAAKKYSIDRLDESQRNNNGAQHPRTSCEERLQRRDAHPDDPTFCLILAG